MELIRTLICACLLVSAACAEDLYIAATATGAQDGSSCGNALLYTFFNSSGNWAAGAGKISAGDTVHICGTITGAANSTLLTFQGSGTNGNVITLLFESSASLEAPYFQSSVGGGAYGAVSASGKSYITIDGGANGIVRNTANGSSLTYSVASTGISLQSCTSCEVKNLTVRNIYVHVANSGVAVDSSEFRAIDWNGSSNSIHNNTVSDCGWCLFDSYGAGDANNSVYANDLSAFGHAILYADAGGHTSSNVFIYGNHFHDAANWAVVGCGGIHVDGIHTFGVAGSSIDNFYVYNNLFDGDWGTCPTGFIYVEGGTLPNNNPTNMQNSYWWNNVFIVTNGIENTNGWVTISGKSGVQKVLNNTIIGTNSTDNTTCWSIADTSGLTFENNVTSNCGHPFWDYSGGVFSVTISTLDYNFWGPYKEFYFNGGYRTYAQFRTATGGDSNGVQNNTPLLNTDGSPQTSSPVIAHAANLTSTAIGSLATLANDTTKGGVRSALSRPGGSTAWDIGAYQYAAGASSGGTRRDGKQSQAGKVTIQ